MGMRRSEWRLLYSVTDEVVNSEFERLSKE